MKAEITTSQLWYNPNIFSFFFRSQAQDNFNKIVTETFEESTEEVLSAIENTYCDLDEFEEMMYDLYAEEDTFADFVEATGLTPIEEIDEDEE